MSDEPEAAISPSDPYIIIAGIKQFGLAPDGSDLQDLIRAFDRQRASVEAQIAEWLESNARLELPPAEDKNTIRRRDANRRFARRAATAIRTGQYRHGKEPH